MFLVNIKHGENQLCNCQNILIFYIYNLISYEKKRIMCIFNTIYIKGDLLCSFYKK